MKSQAAARSVRAASRQLAAAARSLELASIHELRSGDPKMSRTLDVLAKRTQALDESLTKKTDD